MKEAIWVFRYKSPCHSDYLYGILPTEDPALNVLNSMKFLGCCSERCH